MNMSKIFAAIYAALAVAMAGVAAAFLFEGVASIRITDVAVVIPRLSVKNQIMPNVCILAGILFAFTGNILLKEEK